MEQSWKLKHFHVEYITCNFSYFAIITIICYSHDLYLPFMQHYFITAYIVTENIYFLTIIALYIFLITEELARLVQQND